MRFRVFIVAALAALALAACGDDDKSSDKAAKTDTQAAAPIKPSGELARKPKVEPPSGAAPGELQTKDLVKGKGPAAKAGDAIRVQYVGVLYRNGKEFDSSWSRNEPFDFQLGAGMVIPGWDQGIEGMTVGSRRRLVIPPALAYGAQGSPPDIGPNEPLVFVVDLIGIQ